MLFYIVRCPINEIFEFMCICMPNEFFPLQWKQIICCQRVSCILLDRVLITVYSLPEYLWAFGTNSYYYFYCYYHYESQKFREEMIHTDHCLTPSFCREYWEPERLYVLPHVTQVFQTGLRITSSNKHSLILCVCLGSICILEQGSPDISSSSSSSLSCL